jgi:hypothetical protein
MALVGKARGTGHVGQRWACVGQHRAGPVDPHVEMPAMRRQPGRALEGAAEMRGRQAADRRQLGQLKCLGQVGAHEIGHLSQLPGRQSALIGFARRVPVQPDEVEEERQGKAIAIGVRQRAGPYTHSSAISWP